MSAARAVRPTRDAWEARALELAEREHMTGTARLLAENELHAFWGVRRSSPTGEHVVRVYRITSEVRRVSCDFLAGMHGRACRHVGAVLHALQQRERAIGQPDTDPLANWRRGGEW
jgi:hypothetical protein